MHCMKFYILCDEYIHKNPVYISEGLHSTVKGDAHGGLANYRTV